MTIPADPSTFDWIKEAGIPLATFVAGFLVSRFTLTKKDRKDVEQKNYENSSTLVDRYEVAYKEYTLAIKAYADAPSAALDDFTEIATKGDRYFTQLNFLASAILADKVDLTARDQLLLPKIRSAVSRSLPQHYDTLRSIATKHSFAYRGELRRTDYGALYEVIDRFGPGPEWGDMLHA